MTLSDYLRKRKIRQVEFCRITGLKPQTIHRYVQYGRVPDGKNMAVIFEATDGEVTPMDFGKALVIPTPRKVKQTPHDGVAL